MDYSKCWLDYQPVDTVEKEWLTYFQSCEGEIVESAVSAVSYTHLTLPTT